MFEQVFSLIAPHLCVGCQKEGALLCFECIATVPGIPLQCYRCGKRSGRRRICVSCRPSTPLDAVQVTTSYQTHAASLVHRLKYERASAAANTIAKLMSEQIIPSGLPVLVTCAPTAPRRVRMRGYDQSARIARRYARYIALPYKPLLLRRGHTRQVGATREERQDQIRHAFTVRHPQAVKNKHVILIDDVITTGATLEAAAQELKRAGADKITAVVFAAA